MATTETPDTITPDVRAEIAAGHALSLPEVARRMPSYRRKRTGGTDEKPEYGEPLSVSPCTVWRWITEGVRLPDGRRVRLEAARVSGRWLTSEQALARWLAAQTPDLDAPTPPAPRSPGRRAAERRAAGATLDAAGIT
jgi:hypothetical protein